LNATIERSPADNDEALLCGEVSRLMGTRFRVMFVGAGIRCAACGHPWALLHMISADGSTAWTGYCPDGHANGCHCGHNRTRQTLRELGVPLARRVVVALTYYALRQWRE